MMRRTIGFFLLMVNFSVAQNLNMEKAKKMETHKTGVFFQDGVFYKSGEPIKVEMKGVRKSEDKHKAQERLVIDFSTAKTPKIYGYLSETEKILYIDFFNTDFLDKSLRVADSLFVERIDLYPWSDKKLSMEIKFKDKVYCDLFYLESPGRLVIDVRKGL